MPPTSAADLPHAVGYEGSHGSCRWQGRVVGEAERFGRFLRDRVRERVRDEDEFADELGALATTGMATEFLEEFLAAQPFPQDWEIGEALAECALELEVEREICWPWNTVRDRRTPRASLPGADLVGFCRQGGDAYLLFGEVKTSSDEQVPPRVMRGDRGMPWQLADTATRLDVQYAHVPVGSRRYNENCVGTGELYQAPREYRRPGTTVGAQSPRSISTTTLASPSS